MGKVYESKVDPEELIRSFREEPSGLSGLKMAKEPETVPSESPATVPTKSDKKKENLSDKELAYREKFLLDMTYTRAFNCRFQTVEIDQAFVRKIRRLIYFEEGQVCTVKAYINNVLAAHFDQFAEFIEKRL